MAMSHYLMALRAKVGHDLLTLAAAAVVILDEQNRLILAEDADTGLWTLPGGTIDPDEHPADAAVRECWEETGLLVKPIKLIGVFGGPEFRVKYPNGDVAYCTSLAFEARVVGGSHRPDGVEVLDFRYFTKAEFDHLSVTVPSRIIAAQAFNREAPPYFAPATWSPQ